MAYIAYKPRVERVRINERDYCIEEKWYIVKGGYNTIFELAYRFESIDDVPRNHVILMVG